MNTRVVFWSVAGIGSAAALLITQMGFHAQDRQYKKTLQYMHDGRDKLGQKYNQLAGADKK